MFPRVGAIRGQFVDRKHAWPSTHDLATAQRFGPTRVAEPEIVPTCAHRMTLIVIRLNRRPVVAPPGIGVTPRGKIDTNVAQGDRFGPGRMGDAKSLPAPEKAVALIDVGLHRLPVKLLAWSHANVCSYDGVPPWWHLNLRTERLQ
jgi:hypothetical protein